MDFIEIAEGLSVRKDEILAIHSTDNQFECIVITESKEFTAKFPYLTLLSILEEKENEKENEGQEALLRQINEKVGNLPVFAG